MRRLALMTALLMSGPLPAVWAQWPNAQPFSPGSADIVDLVASKNGGFHGVYRTGNQVGYRRYSGGSLGAVLTLHSGSGFASSGITVAEALNGDVHVVFENWLAAPTPRVGWVKSTNGGASFTTVANLSPNGSCAKWPELTPYGTGNSPSMLMSYFRSGSTGSCDEGIYSALFNGTSWTADSLIGAFAESEYSCRGQAWSPLDGSVYRTYDPNSDTLRMRRYTGSWGEDRVLVSGSWPVRQHMAINAAGQVMTIYDRNESCYSVLYTPGNGVGEVTYIGDGGYAGSCDVVALPGTNQFYAVIGTNALRVRGYRWAGGQWGAAEVVMNGLAERFLAYPSVAVSPVTRELFAAWQYDVGPPSNFSQIQYTVRPAFPQGSATLSGTVTNQSGLPITAAVVDAVGGDSGVTDGAGHYSISVPAGTYTVNATKKYASSASASGVSCSTGATTVRNFTLTTTAPGPATLLTVTSSPSTSNNLTWTNPVDGWFGGTAIRFRTDGQFPMGPTDGQLAGDFPGLPGSSGAFSHTGLTNGVTYRYRAFAHDNNASPLFAASGPTAQGTPAVAADFDRDGDVDQGDFSHFQICLRGSNLLAAPGCADSNLDRSEDGDVDAADLNLMLGCLSGAEQYAVETCVP